jgi:DNA-binding winged helix-turn-helix (wHTH) protein
MFVFGECTLDVERRELRRAGVVLSLEPKAFTVLLHLLTQRHRAVSKDELLVTCWPGEFITEAALTRCLKVIRQAIGDDGVRQHIIKTLRGYGYHFIATVETPSTTSALLPIYSSTTLPGPIHEAPPVRMPTTVLADAELAPGLLDTIPPALSAGRPCPQCHTLNRAVRQFCAVCGQALWRLCLHCGFGNDPTERFCGGCGRAVVAPVPVHHRRPYGFP